MGDVVHAIPVLSDIKESSPDCLVDWLVEEPFADIVRASPLVNRVHVCNVRKWKKDLLSAKTKQEIIALKAQLKEGNFNLVIDLQGLIKSALLSKMASAPIAGYDRHSIKESAASSFYDYKYAVSKKETAVQRCRELSAKALGYLVPTNRPVFNFGQANASKHQVKKAVFFANASRETKLWPQENWIELGKYLAIQGFAISLAWGSEADRQRVSQIAKGIGSPAEVLDHLEISQLMDVIAASKVVIGLDTGMTHLSSAMGIPTVALFRDYPIELVPLEGDGKKKALGGVGCCPQAQDVMKAICEVLE